MEKKPLYEFCLPTYLQHDINAYVNEEGPIDCLWCELYDSINCAYYDGNVTEEQANFLREKYLY
jgi:hypothetical protein